MEDAMSYVITDCSVDFNVIEVAMLAVKDHNEKKNTLKLQCVRVVNAAVTQLTSSATIYYFFLTAKFDGKPDKPDTFWRTAVWKDVKYPDMHMSLKLEWVEEDESPYSIPIDPALGSVAEFALECHNRNTNKKMHLVDIKSCSTVSPAGFEQYFMAEENKKLMLFNGIVLREHLDEMMESTGLMYLSDAHTKHPFTIPNWVSVSLIMKARNKFMANYVLLEPTDSAPFLMMKTEHFISRLSKIASSIGAEATRTILIPFLSDTHEYVDDMVLIAMAEQLGLLTPHVGGAEHAHVLLPPLLRLCNVDQPLVRDKALESLCEIGEKMKRCDFVKHYNPLLQDLATGSSVSGRVFSCGLFRIVYPHASESQKANLRLLYSHLSKDKDLRVKKSAAWNLNGFADAVEPSHLRTEIASIFMDLAREDQDPVRICVVIGCSTLVKRLEPQYLVAYILPVIVKLCQDKNLWVRQIAAMRLYKLLGPVSEHIRMDLSPVFYHLVGDDNESVRLVAARNIAEMCRMKNLQHPVLLQCIQKLSGDPSKNVRAALAMGLMDAVQALGKDLSIEHLLPAIDTLLRDDCASVKMNIVTKLAQMSQGSEINKLSNSVSDGTSNLGKDESFKEVMKEVTQTEPKRRKQAVSKKPKRQKKAGYKEV